MKLLDPPSLQCARGTGIRSHVKTFGDLVNNHVSFQFACQKELFLNLIQPEDVFFARLSKNHFVAGNHDLSILV